MRKKRPANGSQTQRPHRTQNFEIRNWNLESATSIGANYREANRAESKDDFIHKIALVEKEAGETQYWMELFNESEIGSPEERAWLLQEATELLAIFTSIGKTSKKKYRNSKSKIRNFFSAPNPRSNVKPTTTSAKAT